jgi:plastocyanin
MKRVLLLPVALLAALLVAAAAGADTKTVQITKSGFTPTNTSVNIGDTVSWHNADTADHQVVANDGSFASPVLHGGESFSFTFQKDGRFTYRDATAPSHRGSVTVNGPPASVTLDAAATTVVYGGGTTLSGAVSNQQANEPVSLTSQPYGKGVQALDSAQTSTNGAFSFGVSPTIRTAYQAHWRTANSPSATINVAPRVGFGLTGRLYIAKVTSDLTYGGHFVWLQRRSAYGSWRNVRAVYLGASSRAVFRVRLPHGRSLLRLFLPVGQAGPGYVQSTSRVLAVRR